MGDAQTRRKRIAPIVGIGVVVVTLALISIPLLWQGGSTAQPPSNFQQDVRLLDGGTLRIAADVSLNFRGYSVFGDFPELGGERLVTIAATGGATKLAQTESATEDQILVDGTTVWRRVGAGKPLFLSVDLGTWTAWLNIGTNTDRPSVNDLLNVANQLSGVSDDSGVVLPGLRFEYFELDLAGVDGGTVTVRIGACFNEDIPGSRTIDHVRRGALIRRDSYASWCTGDGTVEVVVDGSVQFVDFVVDTLSLTFN